MTQATGVLSILLLVFLFLLNAIRATVPMTIEVTQIPFVFITIVLGLIWLAVMIASSPRISAD